MPDFNRNSVAESVPLRDVERTLSRKLKETDEPGSGPVQRARMSNLVVYCDSDAGAAEVETQIPEIVLIHPARVLLVVAVPGEDSGPLDASVLVRREGSKHRQASEQVTLRASGQSVSHLPFAVRELLIGDLPTNLWWTSHTPPPLASPLLFELAEYAQQLLYDSVGWIDPNRGVAATDAWLDRFEREGDRRGGWRVASDLNWRRLKYWRRLLTEGLSPASAPGVLDSIASVRIEHGPHSVTQAWEIAGWLASRLGWRLRSGQLKSAEELVLSLAANHGELQLHMIRRPEGPPSIRLIRVACSGPNCADALSFKADDDQSRLSVTPESEETKARTVAQAPTGLAELVGRQLSDREPDPVFREAMKQAGLLARTLRGR